MRLQTITYRGRPVACATATRFFLSDALERLPAGDPLLTFVLYMCAYAREVHTGELPGPYTDHNARRFARAALVPEELADPDRIAHTHRNLQRTALALKLPAAELAAALADVAPDPALQPPAACTRLHAATDKAPEIGVCSAMSTPAVSAPTSVQTMRALHIDALPASAGATGYRMSARTESRRTRWRR
jgi:hypothetical protein